MGPIRRSLLLLTLVLAAHPSVAQNCAWSRVDHVVSYDASGVWNHDVYRGMVDALTVAEIGGAVWEGTSVESSGGAYSA